MIMLHLCYFFSMFIWPLFRHFFMFAILDSAAIAVAAAVVMVGRSS